MKKLLHKLTAVVIVAALSVCTLASCGLFAVDTDRDMKQVVATVKIDEKVNQTDIYKKDIIAGYVSYGYNYVQYYSYSLSDAYKLVLDNLVNNAVIIQQSRLSLADEYNAGNVEYAKALPTADERAQLIENLESDGYLHILASPTEIEEYAKTTKNTAGSAAYIDDLNDYMLNLYKGEDKNGSLKINDAAFRFVDEVTVYSAISSAIDSINGLIDAMADEEDEDEAEHENISFTARTTPTMPAEEEDEDEENAKLLKEYKENAIDISGSARITAYAKALDRLTEMGLLTSEEKEVAKNNRDKQVILSLSYFRNMINSNIESAIVSAYEQALINASNMDYTKVDEIYDDEAKAAAKKDKILNDVWEQYKNLRETQKAEFSGNLSDYETKLGAVSDSGFVAYNARGGYFYASHLLIGYSDELSKLISDYSSKSGITNADVEEFVNSLADRITVEDLRSSWVQSNYGTYDGETFKFSDKYVYNTDGPLANYLGTIEKVKTYVSKDADGNDVNNLYFGKVEPSKLSFKDFGKIVAKILPNTEDVSELAINNVYNLYDDATITRIKRDDFNGFEDLKFAFSTDTGNFNNYLGYVYSPISSANQYVSAYNKACKALVGENGVKVGSYYIFMSKEYGLHIILCTATANFGVYDTENEAAGKADFKAALERACDGDTDSVAYDFMKANVDLVTNNYISDVAQSFIRKYTSENASYITYYEKTYNDIIKD